MQANAGNRDALVADADSRRKIIAALNLFHLRDINSLFTKNKIMEVWGGIECSINRVGERYFDQLAYDGFYENPKLLEHIVNLGVKTLRFPILWEKNCPLENHAPQWTTEQHLKLLKANKITVVAGLVHHGSGPVYAEIQSEQFPEQLAKYAKLVATQYPWINDYTPINEPLTTARFCGLYGLWHPHASDTTTFLKTLLNQCRGTILAMKAIREVNPNARLVLTEDLTKIQGTEELSDQVDFENHRRWLSIDLLCGIVNPTHRLWHWLLENSVSELQLAFFLDNPMPPDLLGFNYYVTSERFLDHRLDRHPLSSHGGNGQIAYADIEAVRHPRAKVSGIANLLREAWQRYRLPMAITEAHICAEKDDQLRWLTSIWDGCNQLNFEGINIEAVTFWSLFGAYGWDKLLTASKGTYESGAFHLGTGAPEATAVASLIRSLANNHTRIDVIATDGWWERADRFVF